MAAWSPEIANDFIRLAATDGRAFDQIQLQKLVYIAHGLCLARYGKPLTYDRPEAWKFGPVYRRLKEALAQFGLVPVAEPIGHLDCGFPPSATASHLFSSKMDATLRSELLDTYYEFGHFSGSALSALTRRGPTPWREVYADGEGEFREIPNELIRAQFVRLTNRPGHQKP